MTPICYNRFFQENKPFLRKLTFFYSRNNMNIKSNHNLLDRYRVEVQSIYKCQAKYKHNLFFWTPWRVKTEMWNNDIKTNSYLRWYFFFKLNDSTRPCPRCYIHKTTRAMLKYCNAKIFSGYFLKKTIFLMVSVRKWLKMKTSYALVNL